MTNETGDFPAMFDYNQLTPEIPGGILTSGCLNENQKVHRQKKLQTNPDFMESSSSDFQSFR